MKKLILLFIASLSTLSCSIDEEGPKTTFELSKVVEADLPASFEFGKVYKIDVSYLLPSACHRQTGLDVKRGNVSGDERRDIYVVGISSFNASLPECSIEAEDDELIKDGYFSILIDENKPFTFYLWQGMDEDMEHVYTIVEIPVTNLEEIGTE